MVCKDTLKIKNLPKELSDAQKEDFARHFGASKIKVITSRAKGRSVVYAKFESNEVAKSVLFRLHQITILNCTLCVEYAEKDLLQGTPTIKKLDDVQVNTNTFYKSFISKINSFNDSVGFHQPPPPHLKYSYPKANMATVSNIAQALATIPKFYTQVLHLMNRMNLPPPFAIPCEKPVPEQAKSASESELESDEETNKNSEVIPQKRTLPQKKIVKRPKFIKPIVAEQQLTKIMKPPEDVFEKNELQMQRKIELKVTADALENKTEEKTEETGSFGILLPLVKPDEPIQVESKSDEPKINHKCITRQELLSNKIPETEKATLSVFKNYNAGPPTCRLYIKNIAKGVTKEDMEYVFNLYKLEESEDKPSLFDIRLMQEGKMKGQAFITLDNVEIAQKALEETNGYLLKNKPIVVMFAKSAVPKPPIKK